MCGIAGFVGWKKSYNNAIVTLNKMKQTINHRGPDNNGTWSSRDLNVFFAHTRLSIIDLSSNGSQPMHSKCKRFTISFNGEIYNHLEIRCHFKKLGRDINWQGLSDTETLIESFSILGIKETLRLARGMFAIALFDHKRRKLYLIRDRYGEKPLYYFDSNDGFFAFGSEISVFKSISFFDEQINTKAATQFFRRGYIGSPQSIWQNVKKIVPGSMLTLSQKNNVYFVENEEQYWSVKEKALTGQMKIFSGSYLDAKLELEQILLQVLGAQTRSDVPLGVFLSGGIDSSLIAALTQKISKEKIQTFSIGFKERAFDESRHAAAIAQHLGTSHETLYASPQDALQLIEEIPKIYSEPFADSSQLPTILLSTLVRKRVTVALSGDGGDELFGGYTRYIFGNRFFEKLRLYPLSIRCAFSNMLIKTPQTFFDFLGPLFGLKPASKRVLKLAAILRCNNFEDYYDLLTEYWPDETITEIKSKDKAIFDLSLGNVENMMLADQLNYLPDDILVKVDRAAMSQSLETRAPFLDHTLAEFAWTLPSDWRIHKNKGKVILQDLLSAYVPTELFDRPKQGFGVPIGEWIKGPLVEWAKDLCNKNDLPDEGLLNGRLVRKFLNEHISGKNNWDYRLWPVLMWQQWIKTN